MWTRHFLPLTNSRSVEWLRSFVPLLMTLVKKRALILTISFVRGPDWVLLRSCLARGHRPPLYLLHYLSVNTNRMDASDVLKFPCLVQQLSAVTRASLMDIKLFMDSLKMWVRFVNEDKLIDALNRRINELLTFV